MSQRTLLSLSDLKDLLTQCPQIPDTLKRKLMFSTLAKIGPQTSILQLRDFIFDVAPTVTLSLLQTLFQYLRQRCGAGDAMMAEYEKTGSTLCQRYVTGWLQDGGRTPSQVFKCRFVLVSFRGCHSPSADTRETWCECVRNLYNNYFTHSENVVALCALMRDCPDLVKFPKEALRVISNRLLLYDMSMQDIPREIENQCKTLSEAYDAVLKYHSLEENPIELGKESLETVFRALLHSSGPCLPLSYLIPECITVDLLRIAASTLGDLGSEVPDDLMLMLVMKCMCRWEPKPSSAEWFSVLLTCLSLNRPKIVELALHQGAKKYMQVLHRDIVHGDKPNATKLRQRYVELLCLCLQSYQAGPCVVEAIGQLLSAAVATAPDQEGLLQIVFTCNAVFPRQTQSIIPNVQQLLRFFKSVDTPDMIRGRAIVRESLLSFPSSGSGTSFSINTSISAGRAYDYRQKILPSYSGLKNLGNTCFLNSVLQVLYQSRSLRNELLASARALISRRVPPSTLTRAEHLALLLMRMKCTSLASVSPHAFHRSMVPPFNGYEQQDAAEFAHVLFDSLGDVTLTRIFEVKTNVTIQCDTCTKSSTRSETSLMLDAPFGAGGGGDDLLQMITRNISTELLVGRDQYHCDECKGLQDGRRTTAVATPYPPCLLVSLKRFTYDITARTRQKILSVVSLPHVMQLPTTDVSYVLRGVVAHAGSSAHVGHYVALGDADASGWHVFNDENVYPGTVSGLDSHTTPYIALYEQQQPPTASDIDEDGRELQDVLDWSAEEDRKEQQPTPQHRQDSYVRRRDDDNNDKYGGGGGGDDYNSYENIERMDRGNINYIT
eukprot:PhF_6_TR1020/c0_g1_i1/m.2047